MPPKGKQKNGTANIHDKRHESGLAAPGKRIVRQRSSNGHLAQPNANGKPTASAVPPPPLPATGLNTGYRFPRLPDHPEASAADHLARGDARERDRTCSDASLEGVGPYGEFADNAHDHSALSAADGMPAGSGKSDGQTGGTFSTVSTILTYYPLRDAISILILLLSLPPTLVLVIQALFASLTFVPPTAGLSLATLPNIKEMFNSTNVGYPALATILFIDLLAWVVWLTLPPLQAFWLDLSQAVIAVSLSGATASSSGPTHSIALCTLVVFVVHVLRHKAIHLTALDYIRSVLYKLDIRIPFDAPPFATSFTSATPIERGMAVTAVHTILGIHILAQGVATCIRRYLASHKANEKDTNTPTIARTDTEATAGSETPLRPSTGLVDGSPHPHTASSTDGRPPGPSPAHRDTKQRESSSKKKRKQANQVRSRQPLWAAIASTKVTFVKEMEQREAAGDGLEAAAKHNNSATHFVSATTHTTNDRIWIFEVRDTEVFFAVELSSESAAESADGRDDSLSIPSGIDRSKPFYITINGAAWSSTKILLSEEQDRAAKNRYVGEIFGLAPLSSYHCEVVSIAAQRPLCSVNLITRPTPTAEQTAVAPTPPPHPSLRPSSPITTLKQSIQSAEVKLNDTRNRTRKTKKDQKAAHADIKKEINSLRSKLESFGGNDDRQERRLMQFTQHKNQAEEAASDLKSQIDALGDIPSEEQEAAQVKRRAWQSALDSKKAAERELDNVKSEQEREVKALESDISSSESRKERLVARIAQRAQDLEKLTVQQQAEMSARQKRDTERARVMQEREDRRAQLQSHIAQMEHEAQVATRKANDAWQEAATLTGTVPNWPAPGYSGLSSPPTPEGVLPGSHNHNGGQISPQANGFPSGGAFPPPSSTFGSPFNSTVQPVLHGPAGVVPRGRSSSMLSQYSGFTDNGEDFAYPPPASEPRQQSWPLQSPAGPMMMLGDRKASDGGDTTSGSGSGGASLMNGSTNGSNSPRPEAKPFIPGSSSSASAVKAVGTIGPPSSKKAQQQQQQSPTPRHAGVIGSGR